MIGTDKDGLEQLALTKCHSIDLTFEHYKSPHELLFQRFYSHVILRIVFIQFHPLKRLRSSDRYKNLNT
jgi:hypothetical protein